MNDAWVGGKYARWRRLGAMVKMVLYLGWIGGLDVDQR